jgi:hypothetical protein
MTSRKYKNYILTDIKLPDPQRQRAEIYAQRATRILWLEDFVIKGAPSVIGTGKPQKNREHRLIPMISMR